MICPVLQNKLHTGHPHTYLFVSHHVFIRIGYQNVHIQRFQMKIQASDYSCKPELFKSTGTILVCQQLTTGE